MLRKFFPVWLCIALASIALISVISISLPEKRNSKEIYTSYSPVIYSSIQDYASAVRSRNISTYSVNGVSSNEIHLYVPVNLPSNAQLSKLSVLDESYNSIIYSVASDEAAIFQYSHHYVDPDIAIPKLVQNNSEVYTELIVGDTTYYYGFGPKHHFVFEYDDCCFIVEIPATINVNGEVREITLDEAITYLELERITL